jgi:hypothetical protein
MVYPALTAPSNRGGFSGKGAGTSVALQVGVAAGKRRGSKEPTMIALLLLFPLALLSMFSFWGRGFWGRGFWGRGPMHFHHHHRGFRHHGRR